MPSPKLIKILLILLALQNCEKHTLLDNYEDNLKDYIKGKISLILYQNYPNPFRGSTVISFNLLQEAHVKLWFIDRQGRIVKTLLDHELNAGSHGVAFNAQNIAPGRYYYHMRALGYEQFRGMDIIR